jgi:hypothetical protein
MKLRDINKAVPAEWEAQNDRETAEITIAALRTDLERTANERDAAERTAEARRTLM